MMTMTGVMMMIRRRRTMMTREMTMVLMARERGQQAAKEMPMIMIITGLSRKDNEMEDVASFTWRK
jgi:hypothetical protein